MSGVGDFSGTVTPGRYRLVRPLGRDGARVHEARHDRLAGRFALKVFRDVEPRVFRQRLQVATALRHPGIVQVVDYSTGEAPGGAFVVMEYVEGRSLAAILATSGPVPPERAARLIDGIALGLQAAHRHGVAHGRLSPERIFVLAPPDDGGAERTKIVGFALPNDTAARPPLRRLTSYAAPEQLAGDADPLSDQFALGAIAYELLAGVPPFADGDARRPPPPPLGEYSVALGVLVDDVVRRALSSDPGQRWADVYTFARRLREAIDAGGTEDEPTRLAPLPLTVSRPAASPSPGNVAVDALEIDEDADLRSVEVDLGTPAPRPLPFSPAGGPTVMNPRPPSYHQPPRGPAPSRSYPIQPTPTFSFTDGPEASPLWKPPGRRARSGGGFRLLVLMILAGLGGYYAVRYHAWPDTGPLVARATELLQSLRSLAPSAQPDPAPVAATPTAPAAAPSATTAAPAAAPALRPEVVPIAPPTAPVAARPSRPTLAPPHVSRSHPKRRPIKPLSAEAAAEEALLAGPSGR